MPLKDLEARRAYKHKYYVKNFTGIMEKSKAYVGDHREEIRQWKHDWYIENQARLSVERSAYYAIHSAVAIMRAKAWDKAHPERVRERVNKENARRRRLLGFVPLNAYFVGSDAHHINESDVIHIPTRLHRQIRHNLRTGKNMVQINSLAIAWLTEDWT